MNYWYPVFFSVILLACDSGTPNEILNTPRSDGGVSPPNTDSGIAMDVGIAMDASSSKDAGTSPPVPDAGTLPSPSVKLEETYQVTRSTHVYAQGLSYDQWGSDTTTTVDLPLDLYLPESAPPNRPAMVIIHGGGFSGGSRDTAQFIEFGEFFASRGWVCISIDYRLARDRGTIPEVWGQYVEENVPQNKRNQARALYPAARDTKAAIRWLYAQAETYKINTDYITAMGGSAGAALAIMTGVTDAQDYRDELTTELDETLASTHLDQSADIAAILDYWGSGVLVNTLNAVHGHQRYDVNDAPINIVHGTEDPTVLFSEAEALRDAYLSTGVDYAFHPLEGARHGPWGATIAGKNLRENGFDFITSQLELTVE